MANKVEEYKIEKECIVNPKENFRGRSYGDWASTWSNWLYSEDPDRSDLAEGHILFLRGNIDYYKYSAEDDVSALDDTRRQFYNRTGDQCVIIPAGTAVFP